MEIRSLNHYMVCGWTHIQGKYHHCYPYWQIGVPGHGRTIRAFARTIRPLRRPSGFSCGKVRGCTRTTTWRPNSSKHNWIVHIYHRTVRHRIGPTSCLGWMVRIRICRTYCCTPYTNLLHTISAVRSSPYIFKPQCTIWSHAAQRSRSATARRLA
jgi:hypothetical protein